eukprot:m.92598 g.92598  ORF g.92598 m.92598 type:complete len:290 (+) comp36746_c0_seq3:34-903(+)
MSGFKFNFDVGDDSASSTADLDVVKTDREPQMLPQSAHEIVPIDEKINSVDLDSHSVLCGGAVSLLCVSLATVEKRLRESGNLLFLKTCAQHSDLIPSVYEGGFKIWECSIDLIEYFVARGIQFAGKRVLELGCGSGLPGIYALTRGASEVHFQDYNPEVIQHITIPNVMINLQQGDDKVTESCKFYAGDWHHINDLFTSDKRERYDLILTSETIYNPETYPILIQLFRDQLKQSGTVYVAAKTNYFGVGGSTQLFTETLLKSGKFFMESHQVTSEGLSREIIQVQRKD